MVKKVVNIWTCDHQDKGKAPCGADADITVSITETKEDGKRLSVDLCETHSATLLANAREDEGVLIRGWAVSADGVAALKKAKLSAPGEKGRVSEKVKKVYYDSTGG